MVIFGPFSYEKIEVRYNVKPDITSLLLDPLGDVISEFDCSLLCYQGGYGAGQQIQQGQHMMQQAGMTNTWPNNWQQHPDVKTQAPPMGLSHTSTAQHHGVAPSSHNAYIAPSSSTSFSAANRPTPVNILGLFIFHSDYFSVSITITSNEIWCSARCATLFDSPSKCKTKMFML